MVMQQRSLAFIATVDKAGHDSGCMAALVAKHGGGAVPVHGSAGSEVEHGSYRSSAEGLA